MTLRNALRGAALLGLALLLPCAASAQTPTGTLEGTVRAADTGEPLGDVAVLIEGTALGTTTRLDGTFRLERVPVGAQVVVLRYVGFASYRERVTIRAGQATALRVRLEASATELGAITVKGEAFLPQNAAATAHVVGADAIRTAALDNPLRLVEEVPGVDLGAYRQGGVADVFSIRGFGEGGHGGDVAVQVDGIPLNEADGHADGYADLNVLVPLELQRIAVYKGPSSALYGNFARGGTVALDTRKGGQYRDVSISGGAYETLDAQLAFGEALDLGAGRNPLQTNLAFQFFTSDGYSANSRYLKGTVAGRFSYALSNRTDVNLSLRGHSGEWGGPGYIPEDQFLSDDRRDEQGPNAEDDGGAKTFYAERIGVNHSFSDQLRLVTFGYAVQQDFTRFAKFGYTEGGQSERFNQRDVYGAGASLNGRGVLGILGGVASTFVLGTELYSERTQRKSWATSNRVRLAQNEDRDFTVQNASAFVQAEFDVAPYLRPTVGLRFDTFFGTYENADPGQAVTSSDLNDYSHLSPKLGLRSTLAPGFDLRASATNGYILPNGADKYDATLSVDPAEIWQYEVGATYDAPGLARFDIVGYVLDTSEEIVEDPPGSATFRNAGTTRRRGVEGEVTARPLAGLQARVSLGLIETEIRENPVAELVGRELTGVPASTFTASLDYASPTGLGARAHVHGIGSYQLEADNSAQYGGYTVADLTLFYDLGAGGARRGRVFVEIENVLDERYAEAVFAGFGTLNYAPAPPRRLTLGVTLGL